jgi:AcrR family transcriptional regulator
MLFHDVPVTVRRIVTATLQKPARSARKPKGEGHVRRAEILAAAEKIFVECGYEGATIRKIADEVGVSSTALYMHFRDKSEILLEICRGTFEQLMASHQRNAALEVDPVTRVRRMIGSYMRFGLAHPNAYRLVFSPRPQEEQGAEAVTRSLGGEIYASFERHVADIDAAGRLKGDVAVTAQVLLAGSHGLVSLMIAKPSFEWADQDTLVEGMLDALFEGVLVR